MEVRAPNRPFVRLLGPHELRWIERVAQVHDHLARLDADDQRFRTMRGESYALMNWLQRFVSDGLPPRMELPGLDAFANLPLRDERRLMEALVVRNTLLTEASMLSVHVAKAIATLYIDSLSTVLISDQRRDTDFLPALQRLTTSITRADLNAPIKLAP